MARKSKSNDMRLLGAFFKGLALCSWLIVSFGFGMWGYTEINALSNMNIKPPDQRQNNSSEETANRSLEETNTYEYKGIRFTNRTDLEKYINSAEERRSIFQIFLEKIKLVNEGDDVSTSVIFILTAISYGIIGAITEQIRRIVIRKRERVDALRKGKQVQYAYVLEEVSILFRPLFGGLVGFMALGVTSLIPMVLQNSAEASFIRPTALLFFCFFSGLMSDEIYKWATELVLSVFKPKTDQLEET